MEEVKSGGVTMTHTYNTYVKTEYQERTTTHYDKCPKVMVQCPNKCCLCTVLC